MAEAEYDAFISYRRSDGAPVARWLRRAIEGFRPPRRLRAAVGRKLKVYLDTAYERGTSDFYEHNIQPALLASRYLIVVATPAAVRRPDGVDDWMQREVADFAQGRSGGNVVVVRAIGEFGDPLPVDLAQRFPNIEIVDLRGASRFAFLNPVRAARLSSEKLKLIAPLLDLAPDQMPVLRQEEERRQQIRHGSALGATLGVLVAVSLLSVYALESRFRATRALESSLFATGRMATAAANQIARDGSSARLRRMLLNEACDLIDKLALESDREPGIREIVICRIERGHQHESQQELVLAQARFQSAIDVALDRHRRRGDIDAALQIVEAREQMAAYLKRRNDTDGAIAEYRRLLADAQRLAQLHPKRHEFAAAEAEAWGQIGDISSARGDRREAAKHYDAAAEAIGRAIELSSGARTAQQLSWHLRLLWLAAEQHWQAGDLAEAMRRLQTAVERRNQIESERVTPAIELETGVAYAIMFAIERQQGNQSAAENARQMALAALNVVLQSKAASEALKRRARSTLAWIEKRNQPGLQN
jgi:tetratricopeptide (TPR) repeat protein